MTDIAALSFNIDTSNVPPAVDHLNKLSDAADHVRASTRFLVGSVSDSNQALQQLASSGRASLSSFIQISENLDVVTARLTALRAAAADTIGTLGGQGLSQALTMFQQQFAAMATVFGTSTAQLEAFNKQAEYLSLNSYQVTSALQRITQAQQNMTPYGQAIRGELNQEGISVNNDPSAILRKVQEYYASHQNSQQALNVLQSIVGPLDPTTAAAFQNQGYKTVAQRRQEFIGQTLDQQASGTSDRAAGLGYQNQYNAAAYQDGRSYLGISATEDPSGKSRQAFIESMTRRIAIDEKNKSDNADQEQKLLALLKGAQPGSQNAIAAESQYAILNPNDPTARSMMSLSGRMSLDGSPISGTPSWYERFTDKNFQNANANYIGNAYDARRANVGHNGFGIEGAFEDFALNTDQITDSYANRLGLYNGPPAAGAGGRILHRGRGGVGYYTDGSMSALFGAPGMPTQAALAAGANETQQQMQSDALVGSQFGFSGFGEALNAGISATNINAPGINSTRAILTRLLGPRYGSAAGGHLADQQAAEQSFIANNASSPGFDQVQGLKGQGFLDAQGTGKAIAQAFLDFYKSQGLDPGRLAGMSLSAAESGQGVKGVALTAAQVESFKAIADALQKNAAISGQTEFSTESSNLAQQQAISDMGLSPGQSASRLAGLRAYQAQVGVTGVGNVADQKRQDAITLQFQGEALNTDQSLQSSLYGAQSNLATLGMNYQQRNALMAQRMYGGQLQDAQSAGNTDLTQKIQDQIQKYTDLNDKIDQATASFTDLTSGLNSVLQGQNNLALLNVPPGQRAAVSASMSASLQVQSETGSYSAGSFRFNNPLNLNAHGQPGVVGVDPNNNVAVFDNSKDGENANIHQLQLDFSRGLNTPRKLINSWNPANGKGNTRASTDQEIAGLAHGLGISPDANMSGFLGNRQGITKLLSVFSQLEGTGGAAGAGAYFNAVTGQMVQADAMSQSASSRLGYVNQNVLPLLRAGRTGASQIAEAGYVDPNVPDAEKAATSQTQLAQATDSLARAAASLQGELGNRLQDGATLAAAANQGPGALQAAQARIAALQSARQTGQDQNPAVVNHLTGENLGVAQSGYQQQFGSQLFQGNISNQIRAATLSNSISIADPYQRILADSLAQQKINDPISASQGASPQQLAISDSQAQWAAQLDVIAAKTQEVAQGMGQVGSAVSGTLSNLAFSYQHGPGQGIYARQQIGNLFNSAGRSLFNTVVGDPIDKFVTGNLSNAVDSLLGNTSPNAPGQSTGTGGNGNAGTGILGGAGSMLGGQASSMLLSNGLKYLGNSFSSLFGESGALNSSFGSAAGGAIGSLPATAASSALSAGSGLGGLLPMAATFFSHFLANGGVASGGQISPFAMGGVFDNGNRRAFSTGGIFSDPTTMPMALLGEAGPEAIMPLKRGADGKLGIAGGGGGGGPSVVISAPITIGQNALGNNGQMSQRQQMDLHRQLTQTMTKAVKGVLADQSRPGGMIQPQR